MLILAAPIVSEKSTYVADKFNQVIFECSARCDQTGDQGGGGADVQSRGERCARFQAHGQTKRFGRFMGKRGELKKAYVSVKPGQEINFPGE